MRRPHQPNDTANAAANRPQFAPPPRAHLVLDRINQRMRAREPCEHMRVEPAEPGQLQQLRPGHVENKRGDAHAQHLGKRERPHGAEPGAARQHPQPEEFQWQQQRNRNEKYEQRRVRRQASDRGGDTRSQRRPGNKVDDPGDDRAQMLP